MTKTEQCIELSEDYADRAANMGANYDEAYEQYLTRCINREENKVKQLWHTTFAIADDSKVMNFI